MHPFYRPYVISDKPFTLLSECSPIKKTISISTGPISLANDKKSGNLNLNHYQCASINHLYLPFCIWSHVVITQFHSKSSYLGQKLVCWAKGISFPSQTWWYSCRWSSFDLSSSYSSYFDKNSKWRISCILVSAPMEKPMQISNKFSLLFSPLIMLLNVFNLLHFILGIKFLFMIVTWNSYFIHKPKSKI